MERQLFDWKGDWDDDGDYCLVFYDITLKVDIGGYKAGTKLSVARVDFQNGILQLQEQLPVEGSLPLISKYDLELRIKDNGIHSDSGNASATSASS